MNATTTPTQNETILEVAELLARATLKEQIDYLKQTYGEEAVRLAWLGLSGIVKRRLYQLVASDPAPAQTKAHSPQAPETPKAKKQTPKLWELAAELDSLDRLLDDLDETEGLTDQERKELEANWLTEYLYHEENFDQKAVNVACYIKHLEAISDAQKNESRRLWNNGTANENKASRLRGYLAVLLLKVGKKSVKGIKASLSIRKKPAKVIVLVEPEQLPDEFKKVEVTPKLAKIKEHLKDHPNCEFASFSILEEFSVKIR